MDRKYFSISEAAAATGRSDSDIKHFIETGALQAAIYLKRRKFLVVAKALDSQVFKLAGTATFRGLAHISQESIVDLIDNRSSVVKVFHPLDIKNISNYFSEYPFNSRLGPYRNINWEPRSWDELSLPRIYLFALPEEKETLKKTISDVIGDAVNSAPELYKPWGITLELSESLEVEKDHYLYDFSTNWTFSDSDIRIEKDTLVVAGLLSEEVNPRIAEGIESSVSEKLFWCDVLRTGCTGVERAVERAFKSLSTPKSKQVWRALLNDHETGAYKLDRDAVIVEMDSESIQWTPKNGSTLYVLSYKTFENKMSLIRKAYMQIKE